MPRQSRSLTHACERIGAGAAERRGVESAASRVRGRRLQWADSGSSAAGAAGGGLSKDGARSQDSYRSIRCKYAIVCAQVAKISPSGVSIQMICRMWHCSGSTPDIPCYAGVLLSILRMQTCAAPFATVCCRILDSSDSLGGEGAPESTTGDLAPSVVQPLVSLHQHALAALGEQLVMPYLHLGFSRQCTAHVLFAVCGQGNPCDVNAGMQHAS